MRAKRSGRAGQLTKWRKHGPRAGLFGATVSLLLLCIAAVLPVRAQTKRETLCFPLKTTQYRVSDAYGWRDDPFTGETAFHKGIDLACIVTSGPGRWCRRGRCLALPGRPAAPPGRTCTLSCGSRVPPKPRRKRWALPMKRRDTRRLGPLVFRDPVLLCGALYVLLYFDASGFLRLGLLAAFLHEWGHILLYCAFFHRFPVIEVTMTGFCMRLCGNALSPGRRFWLAAAGPAVNFLLASLWALRLQQRMTIRGSAFLAANLLTGGFNLLPIPPLDGAQMAASLYAVWNSRKNLAGND